MKVAGIHLTTELFAALSLGGVMFLFALVYIVRKFTPSEQEEEEEEDEGNKETGNGDVGDKGTTKSKQLSKSSLKRLKNPKKDANKFVFQHKWLASVLKGHGSSILDMDLSPNGKYLVSCAEDRTCYLWSCRQLLEKEHKFVKGNVDYDHVTRIKFSPDSKAFLGVLANENNVRVFKLSKKGDNATQITNGPDFPHKYKTDIIDFGIASNGRFLMTCYADTTIKVWSLKGDLLATVDTRQMYNSHGAVSPCGRFVASCGFTSDVKVWEVVFDRSGNSFKEVRRAFELKGHNAGVLSFDFNSDSTKMVSCSKDGTWKLWNTNVEYALGQDPYLLKTWNFDLQGSSSALMALAPDALTVAIATGTRLLILDVNSGEGEEIEEAHSEPIRAILFHPKSRLLLTAGGTRIHVLHNVVGMQARGTELKELIRAAATKGAKARHEEELQEIQEKLDAIGIVQ